MKRRVAVDIVLLLPSRVARRAIADSARQQSAIRLGPRALPHITLAMASVDASAVPDLAAALRACARRMLAFRVTLAGPAAVRSSRHVTTWYHARRSRSLSALHRACVRLLAPHRFASAPPAAFVRRRGEAISASSRRWVAHFVEDAAGRHYRPHVTIGRGAPSSAPKTVTFRARRLALCQLGNHCTCARVLAEARLRGDSV